MKITNELHSIVFFSHSQAIRGKTTKPNVTKCLILKRKYKEAGHVMYKSCKH